MAAASNPPASAPPTDRRTRLAQALRDNLSRRKAAGQAATPAPKA